MVKISVIVPVYNVERYVSRCLDSILSQSFTDLELLCINDGSTDNSLKIIQQYRKFDRRVKIIDKENGGLSSARNAGIKAACGKYTLFVDSDDKISTIACERLYNYAEKLESDLVIFEYFGEDLKNNTKQYISTDYLKQNYQDKTFSIQNLPPVIYPTISATVWSKLYRTDLIKNIPFKNLIMEDVPFWAEVYTKAKRMSYYPEALYYNYLNRKGSEKEQKDEKYFDMFKVCELREMFFKNSSCREQYQQLIDLLTIRDLVRTLGIIRDDLKESFYNKIKEFPKELDYEFYSGYAMSDVDRNNLNVYKAILDMNYDEFRKTYTVVKYG